MNGRPTARKKRDRFPQAQGEPISAEARKMAATILEVLAGIRKPIDAAAALEVSLPRYYQLEQRALEGLVSACERKPKGRRQTSERRVVELENELRRLRHDCDRQQALVRVVQRSVGVAPPPPPAKPAPKGTAKGKRRRKPVARALAAARALLTETSGKPEGSEVVSNL